MKKNKNSASPDPLPQLALFAMEAEAPPPAEPEAENPTPPQPPAATPAQEATSRSKPAASTVARKKPVAKAIAPAETASPPPPPAVKASSRVRAKNSSPVPEGDVRLTANIREDLHLKLKIAAARQRTTIGELIEQWVENQL